MVHEQCSSQRRATNHRIRCPLSSSHGDHRLPPRSRTCGVTTVRIPVAIYASTTADYGIISPLSVIVSVLPPHHRLTLAFHTRATKQPSFLPTVDSVALSLSIHVPIGSPEDDPLTVHGSVFRGIPVSMFPTDDAEYLLWASCSQYAHFQVTTVSVPSSIHTMPFDVFESSPRSQDPVPVTLSHLLQCFATMFERQDQDRIADREEHVPFMTIQNMVTSNPHSCSACMTSTPVTPQDSTPVDSYYPAPSVAPTVTYMVSLLVLVSCQIIHTPFTLITIDRHHISGIHKTTSLRSSLH
jgi:hypothetical protein